LSEKAFPVVLRKRGDTFTAEVLGLGVQAATLDDAIEGARDVFDAELERRRVAVESLPEPPSVEEALRAAGLDGESLPRQIARTRRGGTPQVVVLYGAASA